MKQTIRLICLGAVFVLAVGEGTNETTGATTTTNSCVVVANDESYNSDSSLPIVSPPAELVGIWEGSYCALNEPESLAAATMEMDNDGILDWTIADPGTDTPMLQSQTGGGNGNGNGNSSEALVVGWHCIDVGMGYWWSREDGSDEVRCNLFRIQQTSFTKRTDVQDAFRFRTCTVPAGSTDRVQPSCNSLLPSRISYAMSPFKAAPWYRLNAPDLPILNPATCRAYGDEDEDEDGNGEGVGSPDPDAPFKIDSSSGSGSGSSVQSDSGSSSSSNTAMVTIPVIMAMFVIFIALGFLCSCLRKCR
eukprot:jgi/Psemu1/325701/estExt_fgenesh1_pg.C_2700008